MEKLLPLTVGLLASALMRYRHDIFAPYHPDDPLGNLSGPPEIKIPRAMDEVIAIYHAAAVGRPLETVTERQVAEEFFGKGFYSVEREDGYAMNLKVKDMRQVALDRIAHLNRKGDS